MSALLCSTTFDALDDLGDAMVGSQFFGTDNHSHLVVRFVCVLVCVS